MANEAIGKEYKIISTPYGNTMVTLIKFGFVIDSSMYGQSVETHISPDIDFGSGTPGVLVQQTGTTNYTSPVTQTEGEWNSETENARFTTYRSAGVGNGINIKNLDNNVTRSISVAIGTNNLCIPLFYVDAANKVFHVRTHSINKSRVISYAEPTSTEFGFVIFDYYPSSGISGTITINEEDIFMFTNWLNSIIFTPTTDPYDQGGTSGTGGGTGDFDGTGDDIQIPGLPSFSATDTGMISLYAPTVADLKALANYLWGSLDITNWNRILTDPLQAVLGLSIVPVSAAKGSQKSVWVGNINTGVNMTQYATQYAEVDCGTLNVNEYWGGYLDYDPYTKAELYLPYIGARPIAVDDIMGKSVHVVYHVDILSGACVAYVEVDGTVLYNFIGQCSCSIPISGGDWTNVLNGVLQIASAVGMMVATEGASIPATIGAAGSAASGMVNAMRPNIEKSGAMSGMGGMMGVQTPYLILTRPRQCLPANQNRIEGYPSFITAQLGELTGFTMVHKIELFDIGATREEYAEIEQLLMEGVIL